VVAEVVSAAGLRRARVKTGLIHVDEGFFFLGFRIQRHQLNGSDRSHIYTYPSKTSMVKVKRKVKAVTKQITHQNADDLYLQLGRMTRGWAQYFRHGSSSRAYHDLQNYMWWRIWSWLVHKHPHTPKRQIIRRYYNGWWPEYNGVKLYQPATMTIKRYRYRGNSIPTPWDKPANAAPA
jgi:RNA-directed DNA polymerase